MISLMKQLHSNTWISALLVGALFRLCDAPAVAQVTYASVSTYAGNSIPGLFDDSLGSARFNGPYGVCTDPITGTIYVADGLNNCIRKIEGGVVMTIAGNGVPGDLDGIGSSARFHVPTGVYFKNGYLYVCDDLNHKIKRIDSTGYVLTIAGTGLPGLTDGPALWATFNEPKSLVVDDSAVVYVADYENHCLRKIQDGIVTTIAGTGVAGDGVGPGSSAQLYRPRDLCIDPTGNLFFTDLGNHKIKKLTTAGDVQLLAGSGAPGWIDGLGASASFSTPVAIDWEAPGTLVVLDAVNARFRRVDLAGNVTTVFGSGNVGYMDGPSATAAFDLPQDICVDGGGNIYVGDYYNNVIRMVIPHGQAMGDKTSEDHDALLLFPNPAPAQIRIELKPFGEAPDYLMVHDAHGALVLQMGRGQLMGSIPGNMVLDATTWAKGQYTVQVGARGRSYCASFVH